MINTPRYIIVHCSDCPTTSIPDQFLAINSWHKDRDFPLSSLGYYGGYHKLVSNGKVYRYREDNEEGAHCNEVVNGQSINFQSIGICWGGDGDIEIPNPADMQLLRNEVQYYMKLYNIPLENIFPHRHFKKTKTCPGSLLSDEWVTNLGKPKDIEQQTKADMICIKRSLIQELINALKSFF